MRILTTTRRASKKILLALSSLVATIVATDARGESLTWNNNGGVGDNAWTTITNWNPQALPGPDDAARILNGSGTTISLRSSTGSVSVGTLLLDSGSYSNIIAGASAVTMNLGSGSTSVARIDQSTPTNFTLGDVASGSAKVSLSVPGTLELRVASGKTLFLGANIDGTGSVNISRLSGSSDGTVHLNRTSSDQVPTGTLNSFAGGVTVNTGIVLIASRGSTLDGSSISHGPLGTGTMTLAGGKFVTASYNSANTTIHNPIYLTANSTVGTADGGLRSLAGTLSTNGGHVLSISAYGAAPALRFADAKYNPSDNGTIAFATQFDGDATDWLEISTGSLSVGTLASVYGGAVGVLDNYVSLENINGDVTKSGDGEFDARHFRVRSLNIDAGTARTSYSAGTFNGSTLSTSYVNHLALAGGNNPTVKLDLQNNDLVINQKVDVFDIGTLGVGTGGGFTRLIQTGFNGGSWNGNGIVSGVAAANSASFAIGYAAADDPQVGLVFNDGTSTFSGVTVDESSMLLKFTYYGDVNLDGKTVIGDFAVMNANFNQPGLWTDGDFNYDGTVTIGDFSLLNANFNAGFSNPLRPGPDQLPPRAELFIAMLESPSVYWEAWLDPSIWSYFEEFEFMNLGVAPPVPTYLLDRVQARGVPEPAGVAWVILAAAAAASPRRRR